MIKKRILNLRSHNVSPTPFLLNKHTHHQIIQTQTKLYHKMDVQILLNPSAKPPSSNYGTTYPITYNPTYPNYGTTYPSHPIYYI